MSSFTKSEKNDGIRSFVLGIERGKARQKEQILSESLLKRVNHSFIKSESLPSLFTLRLRVHSLPSIFTISPKRAKRAKRTKRTKRAKKAKK